MASDYFRVKGDYLNSVKCLQRAIYYAPKNYVNIPLFNLANLIHRVHYLNDSLSVALTASNAQPENNVIHYLIGNIYVVCINFKQVKLLFKNIFSRH